MNFDGAEGFGRQFRGTGTLTMQDLVDINQEQDGGIIGSRIATDKVNS